MDLNLPAYKGYRSSLFRSMLGSGADWFGFLLDLLTEVADPVAKLSLEIVVYRFGDGVVEVAAALLPVSANAAQKLGQSAVVGELASNQEVDTAAHGTPEVDTTCVLMVDEGDRVWQELPVGVHVERGKLLAGSHRTAELLHILVSPGDVDQASIGRALGVEEVLQRDFHQLLRQLQHDGYSAVVNMNTQDV